MIYCCSIDKSELKSKLLNEPKKLTNSQKRIIVSKKDKPSASALVT